MILEDVKVSPKFHHSVYLIPNILSYLHCSCKQQKYINTAGLYTPYVLHVCLNFINAASRAGIIQSR